jgi:hypothetical protein
VLIAIPLAFFKVKVAPGGLLEIVTGYEDLLTMLAQAVIQIQVPPIIVLQIDPLIRLSIEWVGILFVYFIVWGLLAVTELY